MSYVYKGFIPQNIAPKGAKQIGVYDSNGNQVYTMGLGSLARPEKEKLFSFGLISDLHCAGMDAAGNWSEAGKRLDWVLTYFEEMGCEFCCHAGDMTNVGFWYPPEDAAAAGIDPNVIYTAQFKEYKNIIDRHRVFGLPVYGTTGNHESYTKNISENVDELVEYTGFGDESLFYSFIRGDDVFIFIIQPNPAEAINEGQFMDFEYTLGLNSDRRCHVFTHYYVKNDSGNTKNCYGCRFGDYEEQFKAAMKNHGRAIHYHGHSHIWFQSQELDKQTNYTEENGYPSVHIPSVAQSRDVVFNEDKGKYERVNVANCSQGYIVDVYDDCVIYNGIEFSNYKSIPTGTFKIDIAI